MRNILDLKSIILMKRMTFIQQLMKEMKYQLIIVRLI